MSKKSSSLNTNLLVVVVLVVTWPLTIFHEELYERLQDLEFLEWATVVALLATATVAGVRSKSLVANLLVLAVLAWTWALHTFDGDLYYRTLQEDEYLEWATVFAFLAAAAVAGVVAWRQWSQSKRLPWFALGLGLFCVFVAGEEASWGQRAFSYRPPVYFLENNFQQELNIHNVVSDNLRKLTLKSVILGYGVFLAVLGGFTSARRRLRRVGIEPPPAGLAIAFLATYLLYEVYPWSFSGEIVELMLGLAFLFALLDNARLFQEPQRRQWWTKQPTVIGTAWALTLALGLATAALSEITVGRDPAIVGTTQSETEALKRDFLTRPGRSITRCGIHKRVYSYVEKYEKDGLYDGRFAALTGQGLAVERAEYFLDPWNNPYWVRHKCKRREGVVRNFVYSFGPNHKRDSSDWEIRGDDIGVMILSRGPSPSD